MSKSPAPAGTCTLPQSNVVGFCRNRDNPTDGVRIVQTWDRDKDGRVITISIRIEVTEDFPAKYHDALIRVANKCSVKKTIENPPEFRLETRVRSQT